MSIFAFRRSGFSVGAAAALLAGCGALPFGSAQGRPAQSNMQPPIAAAAARRSPSTPSYKVLFRFGTHGNPRHDLGGTDPEGLIEVSGELYGTTSGGGHDWGTVYSMSTAGARKVLHRFDDETNDGLTPVGTLIEVKHLLYGATYIGGNCKSGSGSGSVYSISTSGTEKLLHTFCHFSDGIQPLAGLVNVNGTLYGTTQYGVSSTDGGTVYSITPSGKYKIVHNFGGAPNDGAEPAAPLLDLNGTLYGTTAYGGSHNHGTVYTIDATGKEKVLYNFQGGSDGALPFSSLIDVNGTLYGTTLQGGGNPVGCSPSYADCGTVYTISTTGKEKVIYAFGGFGSQGGKNGGSPTAALLELNGTLYGTASAGGANGLGVIFSLSMSGTETVLHNFAGGSDGANPSRELINVNGTLYGTTSQGGSTSGCKRFGQSGCGTVFTLTP